MIAGLLVDQTGMVAFVSPRPRKNTREREKDQEKQLAVGASVSRVDESGNKQDFRIRALDADTVTVDGNHPLAGETLRFRGKIIEVREATAEELTSVQMQQ